MVGAREIGRLATVVIVNLMVLLACLTAVEYRPSANYDLKAKAVATALKAQAVIGDRLIGPEYTEITTTLGRYNAKLLALHPDFAAVVVDLLIQGGINAGDRVAVNFSGSFPALNIATLAAIDAIGAKPIITSSVGASTWGATSPDFTWLDMEKQLADAGIWPWRSQAAALGGIGDKGGGLSSEGIEMARQAIVRSGLPAIYSNTLEEAISFRLAIYREAGALPACLVNVGGSHVMFGRLGHKLPLRQGLTQGYRPSLYWGDGLAAPFIEANRAVIHLININQLALVYGIEATAPPFSSRVFVDRTIPDITRIVIIIWLIFMAGLLWYGNHVKEWWQGPCR